jgi:hypothetical protein
MHWSDYGLVRFVAISGWKVTPLRKRESIDLRYLPGLSIYLIWLSMRTVLPEAQVCCAETIACSVLQNPSLDPTHLIA